MSPDAKSWWDMAQTVATIGATLAALTVPFILDRLQRQRAEDQRHEHFRRVTTEILSASADAVALYDGFQLAIKGSELGDADLIKIGQRASRARSVLKHLLKQHDLTAGTVGCAIDAQDLASGVADLALTFGCNRAWQINAEQYLTHGIIRRNRVAHNINHFREVHRLVTTVTYGSDYS